MMPNCHFGGVVRQLDGRTDTTHRPKVDEHLTCDVRYPQERSCDATRPDLAVTSPFHHNCPVALRLPPLI